MAITAKFEADFSQFVAAADKANASLTTIEGSSHQVASGLSEMTAMAETMAGAFGLAFGLSEVVNFGREVFAAAAELEKLHEITGITVTGLQRFQVVGDETGNTLEEITNAIVKMENKLAGGNGSALEALQKLGLSFADIQTLSPEQQFVAISDALREMSNPADQVNVAMALFGKAGAQILPTLKKGFDDVRDSAVGMSPDTVLAIKNVDDALTRAARTMKGDFADAFAFMFLGWTEHERVAKAFAKQIDDIGIKAAAVAPQIRGLGVPGLPADLAQIEAGFAKDAIAIGKFGEAMAAVTAAGVGWETTLDTIDGTVAEAITFYLSAGVSQADLAKAYGLTAQQVKAVQFSLEDYATTLNNTADFERAAAARRKEITQQMTAAVNEQILAELKKQQTEAAASDAFLKAALADAQAQDRLQLGAATLAAATETAAGRQTKAIQSVTQAYYAQIDAAFAAMAALTGGLDSSTGTRVSVPNAGGLERGPGINQPRAGGGPVGAGTSYLVGERGPELFTPGSSGFITPGGGGTSVVNHFYVNGTAADVARQIADTLTRTLMQSTKLRPA